MKGNYVSGLLFPSINITSRANERQLCKWFVVFLQQILYQEPMKGNLDKCSMAECNAFILQYYSI